MIQAKKILIVDDEPDILEFLSYNFRKNKYDVLLANNGLEGIELAKKETPDVIISDILMPEMGGIMMSVQLRNNPETKSIPILFLSAVHEEFQHMLDKFTIGDQYVSKPIRFNNLLNIVNQMLEPKPFPFSNY